MICQYIFHEDALHTFRLQKTVSAALYSKLSVEDRIYTGFFSFMKNSETFSQRHLYNLFPTLVAKFTEHVMVMAMYDKSFFPLSFSPSAEILGDADTSHGPMLVAELESQPISNPVVQAAQPSCRVASLPKGPSQVNSRNLFCHWSESAKQSLGK